MFVPLADVPNIVYIFSGVNSVYMENSMGRKKLWDERILLPLKSETLERLDAQLGDQENRLDLIREAIERELKRRERKR